MLSVHAPQSQPVVLLVENNRPTLELYQRELSSEFEVWACQDEQTAVEWLAEKQFQVVILEPAVGSGKGWDLFLHIRARKNTSAPPVILMSTSEEWRSLCESNAATFLLKPILPYTLHETVRRLIQANGAKTAF